MGRRSARVSWRSSFETVIQCRSVCRLRIKRGRGAANISIGQKIPQTGGFLHRRFLPDRVTQREKRIEDDLVEKQIAG